MLLQQEGAPVGKGLSATAYPQVHRRITKGFVTEVKIESEG